MDLKTEFSRMPFEVLFDEFLAPYTTLQIGGQADFLAFPEHEKDLFPLLKISQNFNLPITVLGGGANTLILDGGVRGLVISLSKNFKGLEVLLENKDEVLVAVGAFEKIPSLVRFGISNGLSGVERLMGIPGTFGGALMMNAGTATQYVEDLIESVLWLPFGERKMKTLSKEEIEFSYRATKLPAPGVVISSILRLKRGSKEKLEDLYEQNLSSRKKKQPWGRPCAGSIFKNPLNDKAGRLIEECGLKKLSIGSAMVSEVHANFLVNTGGAKSSDMLALIDEIQRTVKKQKNIDLNLELNIIGEEESPTRICSHC
tara:strand:- start:906 stop:1850 length:945 start_codon:yes stop_codon:yes gene_type:complete